MFNSSNNQGKENQNHSETSPHIGQAGHYFKKRKVNRKCVDEDVKKLELLCTDGRNVKWYSHYGKQYVGLQIILLELPYDPVIQFWEFIQNN